MSFRDPDLVENEIKVRPHVVHARAGGGDLLRGRVGGCGWWRIRHIYDLLGRRGEHLLQDAVSILINGLDAQRQPSKVRSHPEYRAVRALEREIAGRRRDDVLEHAGARVTLDLPHEREG